MLVDMVADALERHGGFRPFSGISWTRGRVHVRRGTGVFCVSSPDCYITCYDTGDADADFSLVIDAVDMLLRHAELDTQSHK